MDRQSPGPQRTANRGRGIFAEALPLVRRVAGKRHTACAEQDNCSNSLQIAMFTQRAEEASKKVEAVGLDINLLRLLTAEP